jgi:RNA polymerase sigma-32 factor
MSHVDDGETFRANSAFIKSAMRAPLLERDREFGLARRWREQGDQAALHQLVTAHTRLVVSFAARFRHYGMPIDDLIQEGNLGLVQAAKRFDAQRNVRFSTYAAWWIRASIQGFILHNWSIVPGGTSAAQKSLFFNLRRQRARIGAIAVEQLSTASCETIANALNVRLAKVMAMDARLSQPDQSLNATLTEDGSSEWQDLLVDSRLDPEEQVIDSHDMRLRLQWLAEAMAELSPRERAIIEHRHLASEDLVSFEKVGARIGISHERVRHIELRALDRLRDAVLRRANRRGDVLTA